MFDYVAQKSLMTSSPSHNNYTHVKHALFLCLLTVTRIKIYSDT